MNFDDLVERLSKAIGSAVIDLPPDVASTLESAFASERDDGARMQLRAILDNVRLAREERLPLCQDTGMQTFFVEAGRDFRHLGELLRAIKDALERATREVPLRPNTVDPLSGKNCSNNLGRGMPLVSVEIVDGDRATVHILPKGGGSENMSALWMLTPSDGLAGIRRNILEQVQRAGGRPCPPLVLGVGIGGSADTAVKLAKRALLRPLGAENPDPEMARLEGEILRDVNELGIGPMGLGGSTTALAVHVEHAYRHPVSLPVALVVQCWCDRRGQVALDSEGDVVG